MSLDWISRADRLSALPPYVFARLAYSTEHDIKGKREKINPLNLDP